MKYSLAGKKEAEKFAARLAYSRQGLVPVIVADFATGNLLMLAYANSEAVKRTLIRGEAWFFSRSRNSLWKKGETSGNAMRVSAVSVDCDKDALLYEVEVKGEGNACHTGRKSCFVRKFGKESPGLSFSALDEIIAGKIAEGRQTSYTVKLARSKKLAVAKLREEAEELAEALEEKGRREIVWEACDLFYHALVAVRARGISLAELERELARRNKAQR
ncbi:MAG: bifunctional phosphoribosyl-AMP cyclohydrolase/phosphoribosyl-ATP diphosphatase HisIE [Candidatus Micrarchaeota archaeon]|nr:bifunctional phosphoribosyl-AMP cyclohydrolase/phosphoribosyl-ATP diphosphatase HisIE [Candidatus Micrarchaeota archaeon]